MSAKLLYPIFILLQGDHSENITELDAFLKDFASEIWVPPPSKNWQNLGSPLPPPH